MADIGKTTPARPERIACAAILVPGQRVADTLEPPRRHHDIIKALSAIGVPPDALDNQGFVTNHGRFLDRRAAWVVAQEAGQIIHNIDAPVGLLFSEHMW